MQRVSYVDPASLNDPELVEIMEYARRNGTPRPESQAIRAHVPELLRTFTAAWRTAFRDGVLDHRIKELCRLYVSRTVDCQYCGGQRSLKGSQQGVDEGHYDELYFVAFTSGQQRWIRTLGIGHKELLADTDAGLAPQVTRQ